MKRRIFELGFFLLSAIINVSGCSLMRSTHTNWYEPLFATNDRSEIFLELAIASGGAPVSTTECSARSTSRWNDVPERIIQELRMPEFEWVSEVTRPPRTLMRFMSNDEIIFQIFVVESTDGQTNIFVTASNKSAERAQSIGDRVAHAICASDGI